MSRFSRSLFPIICLFLVSCASTEETEDKRAEWPVERLYAYANDALNDGNFEEAIPRYRELEARYPYGEYAEQAQIDLGYAYYKTAEPELAVATLDRFIREHPTHENVDYAWYLKGLAEFNEESGFFARFTGMDDLHDRDPEDARNAFEAFSELLRRYPQSRYADDARQRLVYLNDVLARHDVKVARHYMERGAYLAVVNRAKHIIENYQGAPSVEHALGLMLRAYREMGMTDLAEDTQQVLNINYPDSRYLRSSRS